MTVLVFEAADVRRVVEHSILHRDQQQGAWGQPPPKTPAVILVHDQGVYLMSNAVERDLLEGETGPSGRSFAAYARGCDPKKDPSWWETGRKLVGGDDFADHIEWAEDLKQMLDQGAREIHISISEDQIALIEPATIN